MSRGVGQGQQRRVKKDYGRKQLENPFYRQNKTNKGYSQRTWRVAICLFVIFVVSLIWLLLASPIFNIKTIDIKGASRLSADELRNAFWEQANQPTAMFFSQHNLWLYKRAKISAAVQDKYHLASVIVRKKLWHRLEITIQERDYVFIWSEAGRYYYLDAAGNLVDEVVPTVISPIIVSETSSTSSSTVSNTSTPVVSVPSGYPLIENRTDPKLVNDSLTLDSSYLNCASGLNQAFKTANNSDLKQFIIDQDYDTLKAELNSGIMVYLSPNNDCDKQIRNLMLLLKENYRDKIKRKVDLRYGEKIFYE